MGLVSIVVPLGVFIPIAGAGVREFDDILSLLEVERCLKCNEGLFVGLSY